MGTFKPASSWTQQLFLCVIKEVPTGPQLWHKQTALCGYLNPCNFSFNTLTSVKSPAVTHSVDLVKRSHFLNKKTHNTYRNMADNLDKLVRYIGVLLWEQDNITTRTPMSVHTSVCVFFLSNTHRTPPSTSMPETGISFCLCWCPQSSREIASIRIWQIETEREILKECENQTDRVCLNSIFPICIFIL